MSLIILSRRIQRMILCSKITITSFSPPSSSFYTIIQYHLSQTPQQTFGVHFHPFLNTLRFSTLNANSVQNLDEPVVVDFINQSNYSGKQLEPDLLELFKKAKQFPSESEALAFLDESEVKLDSELVCSAIWELRNEWRLAFLAFKWGDKRLCCNDKARSLIIWVLGSCKKFNIAWCLIRDFNESSVDILQSMFIMIDRYAASNDPRKAIKAFNIMENFRMSPDVKAFYTLLSTLCKHGNIEEAEEFMLQSTKLFPLESEGFNVILNGWINISLDVLEAKRLWREMSKHCVTPDKTSYTLMISCFSKTGNLFDSLRLYDEMQKKGYVPNQDVYHSLIYTLTHENCLKEALKLLQKMKEMGFKPNIASYNSMILPLCKAKKLEEAKDILGNMIAENINPTVETYHVFIEEADFEKTMEVVNCMKKAGFGISGVTFLITVKKFIKLAQPGNALKIWEEMKRYVVPNSSHYTVLVHGLIKCGSLIEARKYYAEMITNGFNDPKLKNMLKEQKPGKCDSRRRRIKTQNPYRKMGNSRSKSKKQEEKTLLTRLFPQLQIVKPLEKG